MYKAYSSAVSKDLRVGAKAFRCILKAVTTKGSYESGLSYYYTEFIDMTKVLVQMLARMKEMVSDVRIEKNKRAHIEQWLTKAKNNTSRSRDYLAHHFYGDIRTKSTDAGTCASFALGDSSTEDLDLQFGTKTTLERNPSVSCF